MSVRRGISAPSVAPSRSSGRRTGRTGSRVVRSGRRLRVVLHRERRHVEAAQALDDVVVEADVADLDPAVRRCRPPSSTGASTANPWFCAVISTVPVARSSTGWLMPRCPNPACRCRSRARGRAPGCRSRSRTAGAARPARPAPAPPRGRRSPGHRDRCEKNTPSAPSASSSSGRGRRGQHVHLDAALGHPVRGHRLDAEVDRGDGEASLPHRRDDVRLRRSSPRRPGRRRPSPGCASTRSSSAAGSVSPLDTPDPHRAALAQVPGQRAGVDPADADDALRHAGRRRGCAARASSTAAGDGSRTT